MKELNSNNIDSQVIGILLVVPITIKEKTITKTELGCDCRAVHCIGGINKYCSICGKEFENKERQSIKLLPEPDLRSELGDNYQPVDLDCDDDDKMVFILKEYITIGDRSHFSTFVKELNISTISSDLDSYIKKYKTLCKKHEAKIIFGVTGAFTDW